MTPHHTWRMRIPSPWRRNAKPPPLIWPTTPLTVIGRSFAVPRPPIIRVASAGRRHLADGDTLVHAVGIGVVVVRLTHVAIIAQVDSQGKDFHKHSPPHGRQFSGQNCCNFKWGEPRPEWWATMPAQEACRVEAKKHSF